MAVCCVATLLGLAGCGGGGSTPPSQPAPAPAPSSTVPLEIKGSAVNVRSSTLAAAFNGPSLASLTNQVTGEQYISQPGPALIGMDMQQPTGETMQPSGWKLQPDPDTGQTVAVNTFSDSVSMATMTVGMDSANDEIFLRLEAHSSRPGVRGLFWGTQGLDLSTQRLVIPGQAGAYYDAQSTPAEVALDYPTHWEDGFVIYQGAQGSVLLYARDTTPVFKRLIATRDTGTLKLGLETFAQGPWSQATQVPKMEWRLKAFSGDWRPAADYYAQWSRNAWPSPASDPGQDWVKQISTVIIVYNPDSVVLAPLAARLDPAKTLLYLVNWRSSGFDVNYPDYTPSDLTQPFIDAAHQLGFRVMLHVSLLGVSNTNPDYQTVSQYQMRDPESEALLTWPFGVWPGGVPPPGYAQTFAFISPASSTYRKLFLSRITPMIQLLHPDALHLDAGGAIVDDGNGLVEGMNSVQGIIELHKELRNAFPGLALGFESTTETLARYHSFAQRWVESSPAHPIQTYLMGSQVHFYGFLDQPNPDDPDFPEHLRRYEGQGIQPTIRIESLQDITAAGPITNQTLDLLKLWQTDGFVPDWQTGWNGDIFRYRGNQGTTAEVKATGPLVQLKVGDTLEYQRVRNSEQIQTDQCITNWPAYTSSTLIGLDPGREYWLESCTGRDTTLPHLTALPADVRVGIGTLITPTYAYFELEPDQQPTYDFVAHFWQARQGTIYNLKDVPLTNGSFVSVITPAVVGGKDMSPALLEVPASQTLPGATFVEYDVPVPGSGTTQLQFATGILDAGTRSDGVTFVIWINGTEVWRQFVLPGSWNPASVDLTPYAGQTVKLRFITHPGPKLNAVDDLACWGGLQLVHPGPSSAQVSLVLPASSTTVSSTPNVTLQPAGASYQTSVAVPGKFAVFANPPAAVTSAQSLLSLPVSVFQAQQDGLPSSSGTGDNGTIAAVASGGVTLNTIKAFPATNGQAILTWAVHLPAQPLQLRLTYGLADTSLTSVQYSGVQFSVYVNGDRPWQVQDQLAGWQQNTIDLSAYAGQDVCIRLVTDALGTNIFDLSYWADLSFQ